MKIVGLMVVGAGEGDRWLTEVLEQRKQLVDDMVICENNTDERTKKIIKQSGFWHYDDNREWGIDQPRIKTDLLRKVGKLRPDWVLPSDADELYDKYFTREEAERLADSDAISYTFFVVNLWNSPDRYRPDMSFQNVRYFKYLPEFTVYENKNLHCGLAPAIFYTQAKDAPFILKHYGLMKPEDRQRKIERYEKYDPKAKWKSKIFYDQLKENKQGNTFDEDALHNKVATLVKEKK